MVDEAAHARVDPVDDPLVVDELLQDLAGGADPCTDRVGQVDGNALLDDVLELMEPDTFPGLYDECHVASFELR
jgi:hypothetical protein